MRLITRYILREHLGPLVFAVTTLTSLLLLNYISRRFGDLVGKGLPWRVIGEFFVLSIPFTIALTLPMAVLIAVLYAFSRLASDNEVAALMACGVGTRQMLVPVLGGGLALSLMMIGFNDQVLPRANHELSRLQSNIQQKKPTLALKPQMLNQVSNRGLYMWISQLNSRQNSMRGVTIYDLTERQQQLRRTIVADSGLLAFAPNERDLLLTLFHGYVQETRNTDPNRLQRTFFHKNIMRVADVADSLVLNREGGGKGDREMTVCEMQTQIELQQRTRDSTLRALARVDSTAARAYKPRYVSRIGEWYCAALGAVFTPSVAQAQGTQRGAPPQIERRGETTRTPAAGQRAGQRPVLRAGQRLELRPGQRPGARARYPIATESVMLSMESTERQIAAYEVEIQKKFAISLACLIFALLGPPIALMFPRSGIGLTIGVSLSVFALYYIGLIAGETLGKNLKLSPILAMWAANAILGMIGIVLALRMGRQGATAHGVDFQALLDRALPWRRRRRPL